MEVSKIPRHFQTRTRVILIALVAFVAVTMKWFSTPSIGYSTNEPVATGVLGGRSVPPFSVPGLNGGQVTLAKFAGHPLVVAFFNSWCGVCWPDMSLLEKAYGRYRSRGLVIVGVGVQDTVGWLRVMIKSLNVTFPVGYDERGAFIARYPLMGIPTIIFAGTDGIVKGVVYGPLDDRSLQENLALILPRPASTR